MTDGIWLRSRRVSTAKSASTLLTKSAQVPTGSTGGQVPSGSAVEQVISDPGINSSADPKKSGSSNNLYGVDTETAKNNSVIEMAFSTPASHQVFDGRDYTGWKVRVSKK